MRYYSNIALTGQIPEARIASQVVRALHGSMRKRANAKVMVAFPNYREGSRPRFGRLVRLFCDDKVALVEVCQEIRERMGETDLALIGAPLPVDTNKVNGHEAFVRLRVPSSPRGSGERAEKREKLRRERLQQSRQIPWLDLYSNSTGKDGGGRKFQIRIKKISGDPGALSENAPQNTYGFSTPDRITFLPVF